jgi:N5-(cytidine 5'-diphosphoramidyl)-L-glutamine hydrolase
MAPERLIAITQRTMKVQSYGEVRDCLDQEWTVWLTDCGFVPVPVPNRLADVATYLERLGVMGVVLTGGNNLSLDVYTGDERIGDAYEVRDRTELTILEYCAKNDVPVIGFCRGMQMLHTYGGGRLSRLGKSPVRHVAAFHEVTLLSEDWRVMAGSRTLEVNSFHDYGFQLENVTSEWEVTAVSQADGVVEGFVHRTLPFVGVGWHPERTNRSGEFDRQLLEWRFRDHVTDQEAEGQSGL